MVFGDEGMTHDVSQIHSFVRVLLADAQNEVSYLLCGVDVLRELDLVLNLSNGRLTMRLRSN